MTELQTQLLILAGIFLGGVIVAYAVPLLIRRTRKPVKPTELGGTQPSKTAPEIEESRDAQKATPISDQPKDSTNFGVPQTNVIEQSKQSYSKEELVKPDKEEVQKESINQEFPYSALIAMRHAQRDADRDKEPEVKAQSQNAPEPAPVSASAPTSVPATETEKETLKQPETLPKDIPVTSLPVKQKEGTQPVIEKPIETKSGNLPDPAFLKPRESNETMKPLISDENLGSAPTPTQSQTETVLPTTPNASNTNASLWNVLHIDNSSANPTGEQKPVENSTQVMTDVLQIIINPEEVPPIVSQPKAPTGEITPPQEQQKSFNPADSLLP